MLERIHIRNFAIIDEVELELTAGMNVLTGETGAGKSILIDALGLVLGDRASAGVVRAGCDRAEISASFAVTGNEPLRAWLGEQALDSEDECLLRRVIGADGRSKGFINGNPVTMQSLREAGDMLVDIHGQHEHQTLQRRGAQRALLDHRAGLAAQVAEVAARHADWKQADADLNALEALAGEGDSRLEFLRFQVDEIDALGLEPGELDALEVERGRLANAGKLAEGGHNALEALYDGEETNAQALLGEASRDITRLAELDGSLEPVAALIREAEVQVSEAADSLRHYLTDLNADPARRDEVENRLAAIQDVARKHRVEPAALPGLGERLQAEIDDLEQSGARLAELEARRRQCLDALNDRAAALSGARRAAAAEFAAAVTAVMQELGMPGGRFEVSVSANEEDVPGPAGRDRVEFLVSANPGQPAQPVARVASGGELSRISLAIQVASTGSFGVPVMVFDEVDSGVGGGIAEIVGQRLRELGDRCQVLCVTHLSQVASQAHRHHKVAKMTDGKSTRTRINTLDDDGRIEEIARMLGGIDITDTTREHAREMLQSAAGRPPPRRRKKRSRV
jgi:DNA repair protein RecN (Recombination protein N)